jgi:methionyl-tRNA formyltransferase
MKTVFFGASEYVIPILEVIKNRFGLSLIVTTEKDNGPVIFFAKENDIPYISLSKIEQDTKDKIQNSDSDLGIVADFGIIINEDLINLFPKGILNVHPSLLPKYRGSTPVQTAILNGDKETGVTIIKIDEKVDHGPILVQEEYEIDPNVTFPQLLSDLFKVGAHILENATIDYLEEVLIPIEQNDDEATFTKTLSKNDGFIEIESPPSKEKIDQMVRAYFPWPGVWTRLAINHQPLIIKFLPNNMVQVEGKKAQSYKDFENGYTEGKSILKKLSLTYEGCLI